MGLVGREFDGYVSVEFDVSVKVGGGREGGGGGLPVEVRPGETAHVGVGHEFARGGGGRVVEGSQDVWGCWLAGTFCFQCWRIGLS